MDGYLQLHSIGDKLQWVHSGGVVENDESMQLTVPNMSTLIGGVVFKWPVTSVLSTFAILHSNFIIIHGGCRGQW